MEDWQVIATYAMIAALVFFAVLAYGRRSWRAYKHWRDEDPLAGMDYRR